MKRILLLADRDGDAFAAALSARLPGRDIVRSPPTDRAPTPYLIVGNPPVGLVARLVGLELILSLNAGVEGLLGGHEVPCGVPVVKMADDGLRQGMVEWVLAQVLAWHRNLWVYAADQAAGAWRPRVERLARERTACVLGAGSLGGPVAMALAGIGFATRIWSRSGAVLEGVASFAGARGLLPAVEGADILVCLLPRAAATEGLIGEDVFSRLAPDALFLNAGRGAVVVDDDLLRGLDAGRPGLAVLDVFRGEPLEGGHGFWTHPGVRITPHVAAQTRPDTAALAIAASIARFERGEPPGPLASAVRGY